MCDGTAAKSTRAVKISSIFVGGGHPIAVQSICATHTTDIDATVAQVNDLHSASADVIRIAVDNKKDAAALAEIRQASPRPTSRSTCKRTIDWPSSSPPTSTRFATTPATSTTTSAKPWQDKVKFIAEIAAKNDVALQVGVNCGSVDPAKAEAYDADDSICADARKQLRTL